MDEQADEQEREQVEERDAAPEDLLGGARRSDLRGLDVSAAARPIQSSVPAKAKAAVTKTLHRPLKPLLKAPGSTQ